MSCPAGLADTLEPDDNFVSWQINYIMNSATPVGGLLHILSNAAKDLHQCTLYFRDFHATLKDIENLFRDTEQMRRIQSNMRRN